MKKFILVVMAFLMLFTIVGCGEEPYDFDAEMTGIFENVETTKVVSDLSLPKSIGFLTIEWTSSNPAVISNEGKVTRGTTDVTVTLTAKMTFEDQTETKTINITVLKAEVTVEPFDFTAAFNAIFKDVNTSTVTEDLELPTDVDGLKIVWTSSKPNVVSSTGKVTRGTEDETVTLTAQMTKGDESATKTQDVTVLKEEDQSVESGTSIADLIAKEVGTTDTVNGTVIATNAQSFLIKDSTGTMLVYKGKTWEADLKVGDKVKVTGTTASYAGAVQFGADATYEKTGEETVSHPTAVELDSAGAEAYLALTAITPTYVKVKGTLAVSGNYINLTIEGATIVGSVTYVVDTDYVGSFNGKEVVVTGYATGVSGSSTKYLNIMYTEIAEVSSETDVDPDAVLISEIIASVAGKYTAVGTVVATNAQSFLIKDSSGSMLVYKGKTWEADLKAGDKVKVTGTTSVYGNAVQFGSDAAYEKTGEETVSHPTAVELDGAGAEAYLALAVITPTYVKVKGTLAVSGNYINLTIEGATIVGSVTYVADTDYVGTFDGKEVVVTGYATGVSGSSTKYLNIMYTEIAEVSSETDVDPDAVLISEIIASVAGKYTAVGTVVATNAQSFLIKDSSGTILVYKGTTWECDLVAGDKVKVTGTTSVYGNAVQFGSDAEYEKTGEETVSHPTAVELDGAGADAYLALASITPTYVKVTGTLSVSSSKYFNLAIDGATITGSLTYPIDVEAITALSGKVVVVEGYVTGVSGSSAKYLNIMFTSVNEVIIDATEMTIAEVVTSVAGKYTVNGVVVATNAQSFLVKDSTGTMLVYKGSSWECDLVAGDKVKVTGTTSVYASAVQFGSDTTYEKTGEETVSHPTAVELDGAGADAYLALTAVTPTYVKVTGTLAIVNSKYFNLTIDGATIIGSITYPIDMLGVALYEDKKIEVTGYVTGVSGSTAKYLNIMYTAISEIEVEVTTKTISEIIASENGDFETNATVVAVNAQSFLIKDSTGTMLVYKGSSWEIDVEVGDTVKVTGKTTIYGRGKQFGAETTYEITGEESVTTPEPTVIDAAKADGFTAETVVTVTYGKVVGTLTVSGNYYNLAIEGATIIGSLTYPINSEEISAFDGKLVEVTGYVTGTSGSDKYLSILCTEIKEASYKEGDIITYGSPLLYTDLSTNPLDSASQYKFELVDGVYKLEITVASATTSKIMVCLSAKYHIEGEVGTWTPNELYNIDGTLYETGDAPTYDLKATKYSFTFNPETKVTTYEEVVVKLAELPLTADFIRTGKEDSTAPEGWTLSIKSKGSYASFWQSFRNNGEYLVSPEFASQDSVSVSFNYYANNEQSSEGKSTKIKFIGLDANGQEVVSVLSDELNVTTKAETGVANAKVITAILNGAGIVSVKIEMVKTGGSNIGFNTVTISTVTVSE